jgi:hypothetical protein
LISVYDIERRVFDYFDVIFDGNQTLFGFGSAASTCFFTDRQTNAPRIAASTLLFYRVEPPVSLGNFNSDHPYINRTTGIEQIDFHRQVHVVVNVLSKIKGAAKGAFEYISLLNQTTRHYEACYNTGEFDLPVHNIDQNARDLTFLENAAWNERIEADFYFNYTDTIILNQPQSLIRAASAPEVVKDKVDFDIELKTGGAL